MTFKEGNTMDTIKMWIIEVLLKKAAPVLIKGVAGYLMAHNIAAPILNWVNGIASPILAQIGIHLSLTIDWTQFQTGLTVLSMAGIDVIEHHITAAVQGTPHVGPAN